MSLSLRDRGLPTRIDNIETRSRQAWSDIDDEWRRAPARPRGAPYKTLANDNDAHFERVERLLYIGAALLVFIGSGIVVGSAFRGGEPLQAVEPNIAPGPSQAAAPPASAPGAAQKLADASAQTEPQSGAMSPPVSAAPQETVFAAPIAPPAAFLAREAANRPDGAVVAAESEPAEGASSTYDEAPVARSMQQARAENAPAQDATAAPEGRMGKCFVRISGRVLNSGSCEISRKGAAVTFQYSGQTLAISPVKGKTWALTLGGRKLGNVYKSGSCWAGRQTYICEKGA